MTDDQIKYMVDRFLGWRLPENFTPDAGISFERTYNEHTPWPMKHEPVGTNLFDASQATEMVRYMVDGIPEPDRSPSEPQAHPAPVSKEPGEAWQPIATAPKDGTNILVWVPSWLQGKGAPCFAIWFNDCWMPTDKHMRRIEPSHWAHAPDGPK